MSSFMVSLWESVFTPGPTPTLLIATNATFGALQLLLLTLLLVTHSIHFIILSTLCAGLWWSINWFAKEVAAAQGSNEAGADQSKRQTSPDPIGSDTETEAEHGTGVGTGTGAEPGGGIAGQGVADRRRPPPPPQPGAAAMPPPTSKPVPRPVHQSSAQATTIPASDATSDQQQQSLSQDGASSQGSSQGGVALPSLPLPISSHKTRNVSERRRSLGDSSGYVSTDSEWEKVSEGDGK